MPKGKRRQATHSPSRAGTSLRLGILAKHARHEFWVTQQVFEKMALQTILTSRLYIYYSLSRFLRTAIMYASHYQMGGLVSQLAELEKSVKAELMQIAALLDSE
jgi:hypothetical protein